VSSAAPAPPPLDAVTDAVLGASRVLVAIAVRSLAAAGEDVTLTQYRALVVLAYAGGHRVTDLATELDVTSSTATRLAERLVRRGLVRRRPHPIDRRATQIEITEAGRNVVATVMARRRREIAAILRRLPRDQQHALVESFEAMRDAADEAPEQNWTLGWGG
jgi:DNA-binding MarR family transcriptional regulator